MCLCLVTDTASWNRKQLVLALFACRERRTPVAKKIKGAAKERHMDLPLVFTCPCVCIYIVAYTLSTARGLAMTVVHDAIYNPTRQKSRSNSLLQPIILTFCTLEAYFLTHEIF